ncbi:hypothetical protein BDZ89DRAFT_1166646 [Hymenopellis radicata]|nr:hypothetical protein BDZ89DRAFT_1166646 [Hymenopellis radicata]
MSTYATALTFAQRQPPHLLPNGNDYSLHQRDIPNVNSSQSSKPLYIINEVRRPIDVRIQSQLSQLRERISTTKTALRELHAYRDSIPDGPPLLKLEAHTRRSQTPEPIAALYLPPPGAQSISPLDPQAPWVRLQRHSTPPTTGTNAIDEFTNMSNWLMNAKDEFVRNRIASLPTVDIPEAQRVPYVAIIERLFQLSQDLEGKLPMLYLFFREADIVRGLAIIVVLIQQQRFLLQLPQPRFILTCRYLETITREVETALSRFYATLNTLKVGMGVAQL